MRGRNYAAMHPSALKSSEALPPLSATFLAATLATLIRILTLAAILPLLLSGLASLTGAAFLTATWATLAGTLTLVPLAALLATTLSSAFLTGTLATLAGTLTLVPLAATLASAFLTATLTGLPLALATTTLTPLLAALATLVGAALPAFLGAAGVVLLIALLLLLIALHKNLSSDQCRNDVAAVRESASHVPGQTEPRR